MEGMCCRGKGKQRSALSQAKSGAAGVGKHQPGRLDKADKPQSRHRSATAFHRRSTLADDILQSEADLMVQRLSGYSAGFKSPGMPPQQPGAQAGGVMPQSNNTSFNTEHSVDSPHSAAPSPLVATPIQQPIKQDLDPTMPTLSPHPPSKSDSKDSTGTTNGHPDSQDPGSTDMFNKDTSAVKLELCNGDIKAELSSAGQGSITTNTVTTSVPAAPTASATSPDTHPKQQTECRGLKRPVLPSLMYRDTDEELVTDSFYDFDSFNDW